MSERDKPSVPVSPNPRGQVLVQASGLTLGFVLIIVSLRLWGRYKYRSSTPRTSFRPHFGDHRFWVLASDASILISTCIACTLTVVGDAAVHWGLGLHQTTLSTDHKYNVLEMFYCYQIFYKLGAGISKVATCFLLLAISGPQMENFNRTCYAMIIYIVGYSLGSSLATVFQCRLNFKSNWIHTNDQSQCITLPPFWYAHAGLNIAATIVLAALPWWLFYSITYKRKHIVATLMTMLSLSELVFGCVRLRGLYISAHSFKDLTYGSVTGILVSALEVNFGIIAACVPTVWKLSEEICDKVFKMATGKSLHDSKNNTQTHTSSVALSTIDDQYPRNDYSRFGKDEDDLESAHSGSSRVNILHQRAESKVEIKVQTSFKVEVESTKDNLG